MAFNYWYCPECETSYWWDGRLGDHCPDRLCKGRLEAGATNLRYVKDIDSDLL